MIYLDALAALKLVMPEAETQRWSCGSRSAPGF
jgi:hypothetical protein